MNSRFILLVPLLLLGGACSKPSPEIPAEHNGKVIRSLSTVEHDVDLLLALQAIGKDSLERKQLWGRVNRVRIFPDQRLENQMSSLTDGIKVKSSQDSLFIQFCQSSMGPQGNLVHAGFCYRLLVLKDDYTFYDDSWSDVVPVEQEIRNEYAPFYLDKAAYKPGDTIRGCVTVKQVQYDRNQLSHSTYLKLVINTVVE